MKFAKKFDGVEYFKGNMNKILALFILFFAFSLAYGQEYKTAKAIEGDGIYSLLRRNGLPPGEYLNKFIELNKDQLEKNNSLVIGRTYKLPANGNTTVGIADSAKPAATQKVTPAKADLTIKLFGQNYQKVTVVDKQLSGAVFYLISGHGGPDPGAVGRLNNQTLCEDEYAYDVTLRFARKLMEHSATVYIIVQDNNDGIRDDSFLRPDKDEVCYGNLRIPSGHVARLNQRKDIVNNLYTKHKNAYQRLVEIHIDSRSKGKNIDVFFYHAEGSKQGKKMATTFQQVFNNKYKQHQPGRGYSGTVSARNLHILRNSTMPAVFIELGNINHERDQRRFMISDNRQALANWLSEGAIKDYLNR